MSLALNPQYDAIGKGFVQQYYAMFDDPVQRPNLANMYNVKLISPAERRLGTYQLQRACLEYLEEGGLFTLFLDLYVKPIMEIFIVLANVETSFMTFEGVQLQGSLKIMEKLNSLSIQKIQRIITAVDTQPMFDGGVLINVLGRLKCDDDPPHAYMQTFVLKPLGESFFVQHDIFRLSIHDAA